MIQERKTKLFIDEAIRAVENKLSEKIDDSVNRILAAMPKEEEKKVKQEQEERKEQEEWDFCHSTTKISEKLSYFHSDIPISALPTDIEAKACKTYGNDISSSRSDANTYGIGMILEANQNP